MRRVALLLGGTFNPPTVMHLRMLELGRWYLERQLKDEIVVVAGLISPVHDAYKKKDLAPSKHRCAMIKLATQNSSWIKLSKWEPQQADWTRTLLTMEYHRKLLNSDEGKHYLEPQLQNTNLSTSPVELMFLCGADVVQSFSIPGLWKDSDIKTLIKDFGIVCITRAGSMNDGLFAHHPIVQKADRRNLHLVEEWNFNELSATRVRKAIRSGECIEQLVPNGVSAYIQQHQLYSEDMAAKRKLIFLLKSLPSDESSTTSGPVDKFHEEVTNQLDADGKPRFACELIQVIKFVDGDLQKLRDCLTRTGMYSGLVVTSKRAVEFIQRALADDANTTAACMQSWSQKPIFCVGKSTAQYLKQLLFDPYQLSPGCLVSNGDGDNVPVNAEQLAEKIASAWKTHPLDSGSELPLLFPSSNLKRDVLPNRLDELNIPYETVDAYVTMPIDGLADEFQRRSDKNDGRQPDVVVFFSPSGVAAADNVIRHMAIYFKQTKYVALGHTTAEALQARNYAVDAVAARPVPKDVLHAINSL